jgi:hypothetical protein
VRRGDEPHVHLAIAHVSEPTVAFLLEDLEELRLDRQLQVADLVEEERASMGRTRAVPVSQRSRP